MTCEFIRVYLLDMLGSFATGPWQGDFHVSYITLDPSCFCAFVHHLLNVVCGEQILFTPWRLDQGWTGIALLEQVTCGPLLVNNYGSGGGVGGLWQLPIAVQGVRNGPRFVSAGRYFSHFTHRANSIQWRTQPMWHKGCIKHRQSPLPIDPPQCSLK